MNTNGLIKFLVWGPLVMSFFLWFGLAVDAYANADQALSDAKYHAATQTLNGNDFSSSLLKHVTVEQYGERLFKKSLVTCSFIPVLGAGLSFFLWFLFLLSGREAAPKTPLSVKLAKVPGLQRQNDFTTQANHSPGTSIVTELEKLGAMKDKGILTPQEFEDAKQKLLSKTG